MPVPAARGIYRRPDFRFYRTLPKQATFKSGFGPIIFGILDVWLLIYGSLILHQAESFMAGVFGVRRQASAPSRQCLSALQCQFSMMLTARLHIYEVRPRKDKRGVDLISDALPFGRLRYDTPDHAIGYAMHSSRSHDAVIRVYDDAGNVIRTHEHVGEFIEP